MKDELEDEDAGDSRSAARRAVAAVVLEELERIDLAEAADEA